MRLRSEAEMQELFTKSGFELARTIATRSTLRLFEGVPPFEERRYAASPAPEDRVQQTFCGT
jgi:hypothetical protein